MARSIPWRRAISDAASWHQDQALNSTIYILRQTGPTGFLLKEEGETKKFKVFLGDPHKCTCPVFAKEKDLCKHIMWVLLKKFRVPRQNPITWQFGLVEREINEILHGVLARQEARPTYAARKYANIAAHMGRDPNSEQAVIPQREISEEDVCPICQDELLAKHLPVTYCKFGCGNNVHIKCMKVWADHQKSSGKTVIECPFCREDFGPISLLEQEMKNSSQRETRAERMNEHLGTTCRKCHVCPIKGKCYKCSVCSDYHLCQACFNTSVHMEHNFLFRQKATQRWRPTANRSQGGMLPDAVVTNLMTREISEQDYDLLLQLDNQSAEQLSDLTEETIQSFPMERIRQNGPLLAPGQQCRICLHGYEVGQFVRRLPCHHKFHRDCIDNWLLHRHPTCPIDGTTYSNESVRQMKEANRERLRQLQQNSSSETDNSSNKTRRGFGSRRNMMVTNGNLDLEIPGVGIARIASLNNNLLHQTVNNRNNLTSEHHHEALVTQNGQSESVVQDGRQSMGILNTRRTPSSFSHNSAANVTPGNHTGINNTAISGTGLSNASRYSDLSSLTVGEVVGVNIRQPSVNSVDENIINVIASTNRRYHIDDRDNVDDDDDDDSDEDEDRISDDVLSHILNDSRIGSGQSEHTFRNSPGSGSGHSCQLPNVFDALHSADEIISTMAVKGSQTVVNGNQFFDPSQQNSAKVTLLHEPSQDQVNNKQNRTIWRQTTSSRNRNMTQDLSVLGTELDQVDANISRQQVSHRVHSASQQEDQSSHVPSIPLPRNDNDILLGIGNVARKPPSGESIHHQGRLRSRITHRDTTRTKSRARERSSSREHREQVNNFDSLYIGHSPSSRVGFNSDFLLSATESKNSKTLQRTRTKQELKSNQSRTRSTATESDIQTVNDLSLSGSGLISSHQQHAV